MMAALNDPLLAQLTAAPGLDGARLLFAVGLARWAFLCSPGVLVALWLLGDAEDRRVAVAAGLATAVALVAAFVLSDVVAEPRPFMDGSATNYLDHVRDGGFPSDHATLLFGIAFALRIRRPARVPGLWMPMALLAVAVGWARIYLGAHYPLDIAGGALVAAATAELVGSRLGRITSDRISAVADRVRMRFVSPRRRQPIP